MKPSFFSLNLIEFYRIGSIAGRTKTILTVPLTPVPFNALANYLHPTFIVSLQIGSRWYEDKDSEKKPKQSASEK